jgi:hypothetical protein
MWQGTEGLLEVPDSLGVGRTRQGLLTRLPKVRQGSVPHLPSQEVVGQALDLLRQPVPSQRLQSLDDAAMQHPPPLL